MESIVRLKMEWMSQNTAHPGEVLFEGVRLPKDYSIVEKIIPLIP